MENVDGKAGSSLGVRVLRIVSDARNSYGLRLQDPARYNTHCAKRILSLKKTLKFVQRKNSPPKPVTIDLVTQDHRFPNMDSMLIRDTLRLCCSLQNEH